MLDQVMDHRLHFGTIYIDAFSEIGNGSVILGAYAGLFAREELGIHHDAVFEAINAHVGGLRKSDGTKMSSDFKTLAMRLLNSSLQFFGRDVHVRFEPSDALRRGSVHGTASFIRVCEGMHLREKQRLAFEIGRGEYDVRARLATRVNRTLDVDVCGEIYAPSGAHGGDAGREI